MSLVTTIKLLFSILKILQFILDYIESQNDGKGEPDGAAEGIKAARDLLSLAQQKAEKKQPGMFERLLDSLAAGDEDE